MTQKVFIATPTKWGVNPWTHHSFGYNMYELGKFKDVVLTDIQSFDESPLDEARNQSVDVFLEKTDDELFVTYDADQVFPRGTFVRVIMSAIKSDAKVVSGWYFARKGTGGLVLFKRESNKAFSNPNDFNSYTPYTLRELLHLPRTKTEYGNLVPVDGLGFGIIVVRREVLEKMDYPYFLQWSPMMKRDEHKFGEDLWFCDKLASIGVQPYVNLKAFVGHWASQGYVIGGPHLQQKALQERIFNPQELTE